MLLLLENLSQISTHNIHHNSFFFCLKSSIGPPWVRCESSLPLRGDSPSASCLNIAIRIPRLKSKCMELGPPSSELWTRHPLRFLYTWQRVKTFVYYSCENLVNSPFTCQQNWANMCLRIKTILSRGVNFLYSNAIYFGNIAHIIKLYALNMTKVLLQ